MRATSILSLRHEDKINLAWLNLKFSFQSTYRNMPPARGLSLKTVRFARNDQIRIFQTPQGNADGRAIVIYSADRASTLWAEAPLRPLGRLEVLGPASSDPLDSRAIKVGPRHGRRARCSATHRTGTKVWELRFTQNPKLDVTTEAACRVFNHL